MAHIADEMVLTDRYSASLKVRVSHWLGEDSNEVLTALVIEAGAARLQIRFTPADLWALADMLSQHATKTATNQAAVGTPL